MSRCCRARSSRCRWCLSPPTSSSTCCSRWSIRAFGAAEVCRMTDIVALERPRDAFAEQAPPATRVRGYWQSVFYRLRHDPVTLAFAAIVLLIVLAALFAPLIAPFDPYKESIVGRLKPIGWRGHLIGTGMLALTLVFTPPMCRVAETATTQVRALDYIEAARASGASTAAIIRYHVLGNVLGPVFIYASSLVSVSILLASGLSFLGLGVRPPTPDWGLMLSTLRQSIYVVPLVCAVPGAAIFITSICFNLVSDGLRAAMDVRM